MPKIPQYNRRQFQSSYVGGPQVDRSGEVLAEGVAKGVGAIVDVEAKKAHKRQQNIIDQQADNGIMQYGLLYSERVQELQKEYADNPSAIGPAAIEEGSKLAEAMGLEIKDERIKSRFLGGANTITKQSISTLANWTKVKNEKNAVVAAENVVRVASLMAGQTLSPEIFYNNVEAVELKLEEIPNLKKEDAKRIIPDMLDSHLYRRSVEEPDALESDLIRGMYSDSPYFDSDMKEKFLNKIKTQRRFDEQEKRRAQDDTYSTVIDEIADRTLPYGDLLARVDSLKDEMRQRDYTRAKTSLFNRIGTDTAALLSDEPKSIKYIEAVYDNISSEVGRAKQSARILDLFDQGANSEELRQLNQMRRELEGPSKAESVIKFLNNNRGYFDMLFKNDPMAMANSIRDYLTTVRGGKNPREAGEEMIQKATRDKVIAQDPSLAHVKDPVEERYTRLATEQLKKDGKPATDAMIKWMVLQLKAMEKIQ